MAAEPMTLAKLAESELISEDNFIVIDDGAKIKASGKWGSQEIQAYADCQPHYISWHENGDVFVVMPRAEQTDDCAIQQREEQAADDNKGEQ